MNALLAVLLTISAAQTGLPTSGGAREVIQRSPAVGSPLESFLTIGEFFFREKRFERARQVFVYGLLHAPSDTRFLTWLARTEEALGHLDYAREYARAAIDAGGSEGARDVLARIERIAATPPPGASPAPGGSAEPAPSAHPSPAHSPSPGQSPALSASAAPPGFKVSETLLVELAPLVGIRDPKELSPLKKGHAPGLDPKVEADRLDALGVLKAVDAAVKIHKLEHPKAEMKELDLKTLAEEKALPQDLDLTAYPPLSLDGDGKLSMEGFGSIESLESELGEYREGLDAAVRHREKGQISEAHAALKELSGKHPTDPTLLSRLLATQMELSLDFEAIPTAQALFLARQWEAKNLYTLALLYFRTSRPDRARQIAALYAKVYPPNFYTVAATALVRLVDAGVTHALIQSLIAQRELEDARAASASPAPSPEPSPARSPAPATKPSPSPAR